MGANKTKINKTILHQLVMRTDRKKQKKEEGTNNYISFHFLFRFIRGNKSYVRKFYVRIEID
jgi:hypothetical protein